MALYAIGDLHLSLSADKPMDVFGPKWENYVQRLRAAFSELREEDVIVLAGDTSWGISLDQALADFRFLDALPGKKLLLKGNHDYWWETVSKLEKFKKEKGYESVNDYKGKLNAAEPENADKLMRTQFLKYFSEVH